MTSGAISDADFLSCNKMPIHGSTLKNTDEGDKTPVVTEGSGLDSSKRSYSLPETKRLSQS